MNNQESIKRESIIKHLGEHVTNLGNYIQTIQEQAYDDGFLYGTLFGSQTTTKVVEFLNKETKAVYQYRDDGVFAVAGLPPELSNLEVGWDESHFHNDMFIPTKVSVNGVVYAICEGKDNTL